MAQHDPHGREPETRRAPARAVRRSPPARCADAWPDGGRLRTRHDRARRLYLESCGVRGPAPRLDFRADPLERCQRILGPDRGPCCADRRSHFRPAGSQGDAGRYRSGDIPLLRFRPVAQSARLAARYVVGARRRHGCVGMPDRHRRRTDGLARPCAAPVRGCGAHRIHRPPQGPLPRRRLRRRPARWRAVRRPGRCAAALGRSARHGRRAGHRGERTGGLRLLRRRACRHSRRAHVTQGRERRRDRHRAARRDQVRKLPAGTAEHRLSKGRNPCCPRS